LEFLPSHPFTAPVAVYQPKAGGKANGTRGEANLHNAKGSVSRGNGLIKIEDKHSVIYSYSTSPAHNFWSKPNTFPLNNLTGLPLCNHNPQD